MAPSGQPRRLRPRDIRYTQYSIGCRFTDGTFITDTFEEILNRRISVDQLEWIEVVEERSLYWALTGNRRLYLYRKLEDLGEVDTIPVREISLSDYGVRQRFVDRKTTICDGKEIVMRQSAAEWYFTNAIERWEASNLVNRNLGEELAMYASHPLPTEVSYRATSTGGNKWHDFFAQNGFNRDRNTASHCGRRSFGCLAVGLLLLLLVLFVMYLKTK